MVVFRQLGMSEETASLDGRDVPKKRERGDKKGNPEISDRTSARAEKEDTERKWFRG